MSGSLSSHERGRLKLSLTLPQSNTRNFKVPSTVATPGKDSSGETLDVQVTHHDVINNVRGTLEYNDRTAFPSTFKYITVTGTLVNTIEVRTLRLIKDVGGGEGAGGVTLKLQGTFYGTDVTTSMWTSFHGNADLEATL